jgi:hypothetical protein
MKIILKALIVLVYLPFFILGWIIAIIKTLFAVFLEFSWKMGNDQHEKLFEKIYKFFNSLN